MPEMLNVPGSSTSNDRVLIYDFLERTATLSFGRNSFKRTRSLRAVMRRKRCSKSLICLAPDLLVFVFWHAFASRASKDCRSNRNK